MKISKEKFNILILSFFLSILCLALSLYIYPYYQNGDQLPYRNFYDNISSYGFLDGMDYYRNQLGSLEPVYFLIVKTFSNILDKDLLFSLINSFIAFFLFFNLLKNKVAIYFILSVFLNFYFLVLLFAAERLKLSFLFILMAISFVDLKRYIFLFFGILTHIQSLFLIFIILFKDNIEDFFRKINFKIIIYGFLFIFALSFFLKDHILIKLQSYIGSGGFFDTLKASIFVILASLIAPTKWLEILILGLPLVVAAFFVGADRIVMMTYILFLIYGLKYKKGYNILIFLSTLYFCWKGYYFLLNIIQHGNGFYN